MAIENPTDIAREEIPASTFDAAQFQQATAAFAVSPDKQSAQHQMLSDLGFPAHQELLLAFQNVTPRDSGTISAIKAGNGEKTEGKPAAADKVPEKRPPVENDDQGRVDRINYADGSYRKVGYDAASKPTSFTHFDKDGKQIGQLKTTGGFSAPESFQVKPDGTILKTVDTVREFRGETTYNRQGQEISRSGSLSRERMFEESFNPDGTHSIKRDYPDKSCREIVEKDGKPVEDRLTAPDGTQKIWKRDEKTDKWYENKDTAKTVPWTGSMEFRPDGRYIQTDKIGNVKEIGKDGHKHFSGQETWRQDAIRIAESKLTTPEQKAKFNQDMKDFETRVTNGEVSSEQATDTYREVARLLSTKSQVGVTATEMKKLASQVMHQAAHPEDADQGHFGNCNVGAPEVKIYHASPATAAKLVADAAITGKYTSSDGTTVDITKSVRPNGTEGLQDAIPENVRSYASQLFHVTTLNMVLAERNAANGTNLEYVERGATATDNGAKLLDNSHVPPAAVFNIKNGKPVLYSEEIKDASGQTELDAKLQPKKTVPMDNPGLTIRDSISLAEKLTGKSQAGAAIGHFNEVGYAKNWILDYAGLSPHAPKDARIPFFKDEAQLKDLLLAAGRDGKMPVIVQVNAGGGFLRKQVEEAAGKPLGGEGGEFGGGHVLCVTNFDRQTGKVEIDNTWGRSRDKLGKNAVTLTDVVNISKQDSDLAAQEKQYGADKRAAYEDWCAYFGKKPGQDYPPPVMGKDWFDRYRKQQGR